MRTMYDSTDPGAIPADAQLVAGYVDGRYRWQPGDWSRFPNAVHVTITVMGGATVADFADVEAGDLTPQGALYWVQNRRRAGAPFVGLYASDWTWTMIRQVFDAAGEPLPARWNAEPNGVAHLTAGCVATQYQWSTGWDASLVIDHIDGLDEGNTDMPLTDPEIQRVAQTTADAVHQLLDEFWNNQFAPALDDIATRVRALEQSQGAHTAAAAPPALADATAPQEGAQTPENAAGAPAADSTEASDSSPGPGVRAPNMPGGDNAPRTGAGGEPATPGA